MRERVRRRRIVGRRLRSSGLSQRGCGEMRLERLQWGRGVVRWSSWLGEELVLVVHIVEEVVADSRLLAVERRFCVKISFPV